MYSCCVIAYEPLCEQVKKKLELLPDSCNEAEGPSTHRQGD